MFHSKPVGRQMRSEDGSQLVTVFGWFMTQNFWEFYLLDSKFNEDIRFALVFGDATEMGDISMSELRGYRSSIAQTAEELARLSPAPGWVWVDNG